jgi:hypothetical protein
VTETCRTGTGLLLRVGHGKWSQPHDSGPDEELLVISRREEWVVRRA